MGDQTPEDFTQTVVGSSVTSRTSPTVTSGMPHTTLEGRFLPGTLLNGRYRIIALLGKGGMGEVYRATDLTLGQSVALKFLPALASSDPRWLERFHSEVRIARQVSHPNVCRVYDIGEAEGLPFLSMEYVDGEDLATLLRRIGRLPVDKALEISRKACAGLAAAHSKGVIHRDLKPHNIMLDRHGEVLICDFGLAAVSTELNAAEIRQGTPAYMAPEQLKGTEVTQASDIYSLGLVLYELFTGKRAYSAPNINEMLNKQEAMSLTSMSSHAGEIEPAIENIIRKCLDPLPGNRPSTALSIAAALPGGDPLAAALAAGQTPSPEMVAASDSAGLKTRFSMPILAAILVFLVSYPYLKGHVEMLDYTPLDLPSAALMTKSREMAAQFGYPQKPLDWSQGFEARSSYLNAVREKGLRNWRELFALDSPLLYVYRQSPSYMPEYPDGEVNLNRPAMDQPNMVRLNLDSAGRLRGFEAVPPRRESVAPFRFDEALIFQAMGFDRSRFTPASPFRTPLTPFDQQVAFTGPHPSLPNSSITLQYGTYKGRLTSVYVLAPWAPPITDEARPTSTAQQVQNFVGIALLLVFYFFSVTLARRNWVNNRADRKGALRLFLFVAGIDLLIWVFRAHWLPDVRMFTFATFRLATAMFSGYVVWQLYLALEPFLRQRWPQSIVTWNRLVSGRWQDTLVGAHLLMGVAMGCLIAVGFSLRDWFNFERRGELALASINRDSASAWFASIFGFVDGALTTGLVVFFAIFGLKVLFRRELPAMLVATALLCATNGEIYRSTNLPVDLSFYSLICFLIIFGITRFGVFATVVAVFTANCLGTMGITSDLTTWIMPYNIATLLLLAGLSVFGFWRSLGTQKIIAETHP
jgi:serine/threonine protein kinase